MCSIGIQEQHKIWLHYWLNYDLSNLDVRIAPELLGLFERAFAYRSFASAIQATDTGVTSTIRDLARSSAPLLLTLG